MFLRVATLSGASSLVSRVQRQKGNVTGPIGSRFASEREGYSNRVRFTRLTAVQSTSGTLSADTIAFNDSDGVSRRGKGRERSDREGNSIASHFLGIMIPLKRKRSNRDSAFATLFESPRRSIFLL